MVLRLFVGNQFIIIQKTSKTLNILIPNDQDESRTGS